MPTNTIIKAEARRLIIEFLLEHSEDQMIYLCALATDDDTTTPGDLINVLKG